MLHHTMHQIVQMCLPALVEWHRVGQLRSYNIYEKELPCGWILPATYKTRKTILGTFYLISKDTNTSKIDDIELEKYSYK